MGKITAGYSLSSAATITDHQRTFVDNKRIVFRDIIQGFSAFRIYNIETDQVEFGPVFCKESHCSEKGIYPFSISEEFLGKNPQIPNMDSCGIYLLDLGTYQVTRAVDSAKILDMVGEAGYTPHTIYHIHESCAAESFGHCCDDAFKCKRMSHIRSPGLCGTEYGKDTFYSR